MAKWYGVRKGRGSGIFNNWNATKDLVHGYSGSEFRSFPTREAAMKYVYGRGSQNQKENQNCNNNNHRRQDYASGPQIDIYTDGSCLGNGQYGASAGWGVFWGDDNNLNCYGPVASGDQTNNRGELMAVRNALNQIGRHPAKRDANFTIYTDSQYTINATHKWADSWEQNGWRRAGGPIKNLALIREIRAILADFRSRNITVRFEHVRGHQNNYGNEQADSLARQGAGCNINDYSDHASVCENGHYS